MWGTQVKMMCSSIYSHFQLTARNMKAYAEIEECPDGHDNLMVS